MAQSDQLDDHLEKNRVPAIDRMMDMLELIERRLEGATIRELSETLGLPRSTVYRILNTLELRGMVRRSVVGTYMLGPRLLAFATNVADAGGYEIADIAAAHLERLSEATGEASKISVRDGDGVLVAGRARGPREYSLSIKAGRRLPFHAGAASKVLLAHLEKSEIDRLLSGELPAYTTRTVTDPKKLMAELRKIRRQGWGFDNGEYSNGVYAYAAPVRNRVGKVVAAVSVPFLNEPDVERRERLRLAVVAAADAISADL
jgi:DNA-binding IclR family transcriptional regulator